MNENGNEKATKSNKKQQRTSKNQNGQEKTKTSNEGHKKCSLLLFVARFGFLWMFPFEHRIARCGILLVRKATKSNKRQKKSKWKPGLKC